MSGEGAFWDSAQSVMQALGLDPCRVENVVRDGFPDVSYTHGLIELKAKAEWPKKARTGVDLEFRPGQVPFLSRRWEKGGLCWVLARVERQWLLFDGWTSIQLKDCPCRADMIKMAAWVSEPRGILGSGGRLALERWLRGDPDQMLPNERCRFYRLKARQSLSNLAADIGWPTSVIREAEEGSDRTQDLLDTWEC